MHTFYAIASIYCMPCVFDLNPRAPIRGAEGDTDDAELDLGDAEDGEEEALEDDPEMPQDQMNLQCTWWLDPSHGLCCLIVGHLSERCWSFGGLQGKAKY